MALARAVLKNLQQRGVGRAGVGLGGAQGQGWSYGLLQRFSSEGKEVAVQSGDQGGSGGRRSGSRWRSLLPRRLRRPSSLWRRREARDRDLEPFDNILPSTLLEAAENINRLFENVIPSQIAAPTQLMGRFKETNDSYKLRYDIPGLAKEDLKVTVDDGVLRIRGERKVEEEDDSEDEHWMSYGFYNTSLVLPEDAKQDDIKAELKDGVLSITIPKTESHGKNVKEVQIV